MTLFNNVTHANVYMQALQLNPTNIPEMEVFVGGSQKGTLLPEVQREVEFWDKWVEGGQEQRIKMTDYAVKYPNGYIHVVTSQVFHKLYKV